MATTFKFGNKNWAVKEDYVLAYNDENDNFKPLPFDFTRATTATYLDSDGLIKTANSGYARIDYTDNTDGHLLLEPSRTNNVDNSTDFFSGSWSGTRVSEGSTIVAPDGTDSAHKLIASTADNTHYRNYDISSAAAGTYAGSCFFKKGEHTIGGISIWSDGATNRYGVLVDLENGNFVESATQGSPTGTSYKIEDYGNGWYRVSATITNTSGYVRLIPIIAKDNYTSVSSTVPVFVGSGTDGGYAWGAQLETGSYATSYIPTTGSSVTRSAETCNSAGTSAEFNDSEGVLYAESSVFDTANVFKTISINDDSLTDRVTIGFYGSSIYGYVHSSSTAVLNSNYTPPTTLDANKVAVKYKANDFALWVNGYEVATDTSGSVPTGLTQVDFDAGNGTQNHYGNTKEVIAFNEALTDSELEALTSWGSFTEMAEGQQYTIR